MTGLPDTRRRYACEVCKAKPGQECSNTINPGRPLPGRGEHFARVLPPSRSTSEPKSPGRNEMLS